MVLGLMQQEGGVRVSFCCVISGCAPAIFRHDCGVAWSLPNILRMLMAVACLQASHSAVASDLATLETKGNRPLSLGTLEQGSLVHPNRGYRFAEIPKSISG